MSNENEKKGLLGSAIYWVKNIVGDTISSKKTMFSALSIYLLAQLVLKTMQSNAVVAVTALICATLCFIAWIFCQKSIDSQKIEMRRK